MRKENFLVELKRYHCCRFLDKTKYELVQDSKRSWTLLDIEDGKNDVIEEFHSIEDVWQYKIEGRTIEELVEQGKDYRDFFSFTMWLWFD